jgi:hypothetical protein
LPIGAAMVCVLGLALVVVALVVRFRRRADAGGLEPQTR